MLFFKKKKTINCEDDFWHIIEKAGAPDNCPPYDHCEIISKILSKKSKEDLIAFANIHKEILCKAYTWKILKANFIIISYTSDDVFQDFRNWIILNGKDRFYKTLENPDYMAEYIDVQDPTEDICGELLHYVCDNAYKGNIEELEKHYIYPKEPTINDEWPEKHDLAIEFPNIYKKFWNQDTINEIHKE